LTMSSIQLRALMLASTSSSEVVLETRIRPTELEMLPAEVFHGFLRAITTTAFEDT
jgi:hypothetical protein